MSDNEKTDEWGSINLLIWSFLLINGPWLLFNQVINGFLELEIFWIEGVGTLYNMMLSPFALFVIVWRIVYVMLPDSINFDRGVAAMYVAFVNGPVIIYATYPTLLYMHGHRDDHAPFDVPMYYRGLIEYLAG